MRTFRVIGAAAVPLILAATAALVGSQPAKAHTQEPRAAQTNATGDINFNMPITVNIDIGIDV